MYSASHFADNGCDGGACAVGFAIYSLPLLFAWVLFLFGFRLVSKHRTGGFILIGLAQVINVLLYSEEHNYRLEELNYTVVGCVIFQIFLVLHKLFRENGTLKKWKKAIQEEKSISD